MLSVFKNNLHSVFTELSKESSLRQLDQLAILQLSSHLRRRKTLRDMARLICV